MNLSILRAYFETSPAVKLFRAQNAPYVIDFLDRTFRQPGHITVSAEELLDALTAYREGVQETNPEALRDKPETYLSNWCANETRWLRRSLEGLSETLTYQLTPHAQEVLSHLDRVLGSNLGFVGTESRLRLVIETLADLVVKASADPDVRLSHLRAEKARIEAEIEQIEHGGPVARYHPSRIREQFDTAVSLLKELQGDFRAVEERFREIARQVHQRQTAGRDARGDILEFALEAESALKQEDQGVSFHEFVRLILAPSQQDRLLATIQALGCIPELTSQVEGLDTVRRMIPLLAAEAEKVLRTNQRLSAALRRLLGPGASRDRQRVGSLCAEILHLAASLADDPPRDVGAANVETTVAISSPFARPFWSEPARFAPVDLTEQACDEDRRADAFRLLAAQPRLDWRKMRERINTALGRSRDVTLRTLLTEYPPEVGVVEILGYVQIAHDDGHYISPEATEEITLPVANGRTRVLTVPLVRYVIP